MSAQDHLNPQQFYHGTPHEFKPGEMVEPGRMMDHAYASTSAAVARGYGNRVYQVEFTGPSEPDPEMPSPSKAMFYQDPDPAAPLIPGKSLMDSNGNTLLHGKPPAHQARMSLSPMRVVADVTDYANDRLAAKDFI